MVIYEGSLAFGSCFADYAVMWTVILVVWFAAFVFIYRVRRRRGTAMEVAIWRWVGGGVSLLLVAIAVGFAFSERKTVQVATIDKDINVIGCVGVNRETARLPLSQVQFEYASHRQSGQKSSRIVHEFFVRPLDKSGWLARFRADSDGVNMAALRKLVPEAVAAYENAVKR